MLISTNQRRAFNKATYAKYINKNKFQRYNYSVEEAVEKLQNARPHIVLREVHMKVLNEFYNLIHTEADKNQTEGCLAEEEKENIEPAISKIENPVQIEQNASETSKL